MPSLTTVHDSPISQQHSSTTPRGRIPQAPPFPTAMTNTENEQQTIDPDDEEKTSLINEILRLEKSMNGALRASRDEMESLKETSAKKKQQLKQMEDELENIMKKLGEINNSKQPPPQSQQPQSMRRQSSNSIGSGGRRRLTIATASGGGGGGATTDMRKSLMRQNSLLRRVSVTGDRPFFRRPPLKDDDAELRESVRRRSDPVIPPDSNSFKRMATGGTSCDDASRQSSKESRESRSNNRHQPIKQSSFSSLGRKLNLGNIDNDSSDDSNPQKDSDVLKNNEEETDQEITNHKETLHSKNERIAQLQKEQSSNANQLSYLQSKLQSIQTQSRSRWVQHTKVVEQLHNQKRTLSKSVERRGRLINEVEGCLDGYQERIEQLEKEIEAKQMEAEKKKGQFRVHRQHDAGKNNSDASELEEEIRRYQLRLQIHSQYTAKTLHSFLRIMDTAKKNDTDGILSKNTEGQGNHTINNDEHNSEEGQNDKEEQREHLIEKIAFDVDIQLKFLDRMIREVDSKVKEYQLLSSVELDQVAHATNNDCNEDEVAEDPTNHQPNQLLVLTEECSDLLSDFISTISNTMESTVRAAPHSLSIEFQPSPCSSDKGEAKMNNNGVHDSKNNWTASLSQSSNIHNNHNNGMGDAELPYFQIQRKRLQLHDLQRSQLQVNSNISLLQNDIQSFQTSMHEEKRAHSEMISDLQSKLGILMERLEDGGEEINGLVKELERWKQREDVLLKEYNRHT